MDTTELIRLLKIKDERGLSYLFDHYSGALNGIIIRILHSEKLAEEVLQQTFMKIWEKIDLYDESKSQFFTWMSRIARNSAIDVKRLKRYQNLKNTQALDLNIHNVQGDQISLAGMDVQTLTAKLHQKHKAVLDHTYLFGYTQKETAEKLEIPLGTVKTRVRKAIKELRKILKEEKVLFVGSTSFILILISFICL